jgi:hypothetical protein
MEDPLMRAIGEMTYKKVEELKNGTEGVMRESGSLATRTATGKFTSKTAASIRENSTAMKYMGRGAIAGREVGLTRGSGSIIE